MLIQLNSFGNVIAFSHAEGLGCGCVGEAPQRPSPVKALIISLVIWTFILPSLLGMWLILTFLRWSIPNVYLALVGLMIALAPLAIIREDHALRSRRSPWNSDF